ncbi:MAG: hypothetical protein KatS3mg114_0697 [Planctomycetaceae bacterium]|nr:MAG: hypothetical protein KatS3mg114_0697 [Planctomycetaceae bacterium]
MVYQDSDGRHLPRHEGWHAACSEVYQARSPRDHRMPRPFVRCGGRHRPPNDRDVRTHHAVRGRRCGVITLELIIVAPVLVIFLLAIIEFALIYRLNLQVAGAARYGAKLASEIARSQAISPNLSNYNTPVANNLKARIDSFLANHGLTPSCAVILQHTACGTPTNYPNNYQSQPASIPPTCPCTIVGGTSFPFGLPAFEPPPGTAYARVTVVVPLAGNVPNLLAHFGLPVGNLTLQESVVFRLETNNTPPSGAAEGNLSGSLPTNYVIESGMFPLTCGNSVQIGNPLGTSGGGSFTLNFTADAAQDIETPDANLTYSWVVTILTNSGNASAAPASGSGSTFTTTVTVPNDPNTDPMTTQPDAVNTYRITLTVTDPCGASATCQMTVVTITRDSQP